MDRYRTLCAAPLPDFATGTGMFAFGSWQGTAGSQRLELTVANVGTTGYHCKELPVPEVGTPGSQLGTMGYHCKQLPVTRGWNSCFPTWEPKVTIAKNFRFLKLELTVPNVGTTMARNCRFPTTNCKEHPVPRS